jgi:hypothetical protein
LQAVHDQFFHDYNHQLHAAYGDRADLDRLFRLPLTPMLNGSGVVRFRQWRLYGERAAVWVDGETLTVEHATDIQAQYRATGAADGRHLKEVDEPRLYADEHASPQPFLPDLVDLDWRPVQSLAPYRARRRRQAGAQQERLLEPVRDFAQRG